MSENTETQTKHLSYQRTAKKSRDECETCEHLPMHVAVRVAAKRQLRTQEVAVIERIAYLRTPPVSWSVGVLVG